MTDAPRPSRSFARLAWELASGQRPIERSGPLLEAFIRMPVPLRDAIRWLVRPQRRFLYGRLRVLARDRVLSGPFAGMKLAGVPAAPELLGCFEHELVDVVRALATHPFTRVINVGARYGYYAIGLARLMPDAEVHAFEAIDETRRTLVDAAAVNGVSDRMRVGGFCDVPELAAALGDSHGALVICDIEGGEVTLLDPVRIPGLSRATLLVECHGPPESPTEPVMSLRFQPTHEQRRIDTEPRVLAHLPADVAEPWRSRMPATLEALMQEHRTPPQSWLLLTPRVRAAATPRP